MGSPRLVRVPSTAPAPRAFGDRVGGAARRVPQGASRAVGRKEGRPRLSLHSMARRAHLCPSRPCLSWQWSWWRRAARRCTCWGRAPP
eukprot:1416305-Prymnesium_polylepis.1